MDESRNMYWLVSRGEIIRLLKRRGKIISTKELEVETKKVVGNFGCCSCRYISAYVDAGQFSSGDFQRPACYHGLASF